MVNILFIITLLLIKSIQDNIPKYNILGKIPSLKIENNDNYYESIINNINKTKYKIKNKSLSNDYSPFYCDEDYYDYGNKRYIFFSNIKNIYVDKIDKISLDYQNYSVLKFVIDNITNDVAVNIHSTNCKIKIDFENTKSNESIINRMNNDTFSFIVNSSEINNDFGIRITPLMDSIDERIKENYKNKTCPIIITNYQIKNESIPTLELKESSNFYFDENLKDIQYIYKINSTELDSPIALSLTFNQKSKFNVSIKKSGSEGFFITKEIFNSSIIFIDKDEFKEGDILIIQIKYINYLTPVFMNIKIVKKTSVSILEQNNLNFGFITSNIEYQYYYMEVFKDQECEIMLHNKRQKGILIADIKEKNKINNLYNINNYPKKENKTNLAYNQHYLKLNFTYEQTSICENGCYLLITYYKEIYDSLDENNYIIGYEYTILSRIWDYIEFNSQIVNIPFNEYIFGSFTRESIINHYYSTYIPNEVDKIIIQLEGNYLDAFVGEGIVKLNTMKTLKNVINLNITKNQNFIELTKDILNFTLNNTYISLAFRSKNFFEDIFSFYYFRMFYLKEKENLYYPVDSNFGNLCLPIFEQKTGLYYCNLILKNDYNELSSIFAIADANEIEYSLVYITTFYQNSSKISEEQSLFKYIFKNNNYTKNISHFIFRFEFEENGIKNIISTFYNKISNNYPQIYSSEMYYGNASSLFFNYALEYNYLFTTKYIAGGSFFLNLNYLLEEITLARNYRGKPISIQISPGTKSMKYRSKNEFVFYLKIEYSMKNKGIEEIIPGETKSHIINSGYFPLYYYLYLNETKNLSVDISIRLNSYNLSELKNDFEIKGYLVDENTIKSKIRGEYIELDENKAIHGIFMECYKFGLLQIKGNTSEENKYLLISISNKDKSEFQYNILVEIIYNEYKNRYFIPINQYIIQTFDITNNSVRNVNKYAIAVNDRFNRTDDSILIDFSPNYADLELNFEAYKNISVNYNYTNFQGFKKYRIYENKTDIIHFNVKNPLNRSDANYMLRYYYSEESGENRYNISNFIFETNNKSSQYCNIKISFEMEVYRNNSILPNNKTQTITFKIFAFLFNHTNEGELFNTSALIHDYNYIVESESIYNELGTYNYLFFENIEFHHVYQLQLRVNVLINNTIFNEEFLTYNFTLYLPYENKEKNIWYILKWVLICFGIFSVFVIIIVLFVRYKNLQKNNKELKEKVLLIGYSAGIEKNVLVKEEVSKRDDDYENTFI